MEIISKRPTVLLRECFPPKHLQHFAQHNVILASVILTRVLCSPHPIGGYLEALRQLPPSLPTFDVIAKLLGSPVKFPEVPGDHPKTVGEFIKKFVLGGFITNCIAAIENSAMDESVPVEVGARNTKLVRHTASFVGVSSG